MRSSYALLAALPVASLCAYACGSHATTGFSAPGGGASEEAGAGASSGSGGGSGGSSGGGGVTLLGDGSPRLGGRGGLALRAPPPRPRTIS